MQRAFARSVPAAFFIFVCHEQVFRRPLARAGAAAKHRRRRMPFRDAFDSTALVSASARDRAIGEHLRGVLTSRSLFLSPPASVVPQAIGRGGGRAEDEREHAISLRPPLASRAHAPTPPSSPFACWMTKVTFDVRRTCEIKLSALRGTSNLSSSCSRRRGSPAARSRVERCRRPTSRGTRTARRRRTPGSIRLRARRTTSGSPGSR